MNDKGELLAAWKIDVAHLNGQEGERMGETQVIWRVEVCGCVAIVVDVVICVTL